MLEDDYLTVSQASKLLKISGVAVRKRIKSGTLLAVRVGRDYLIPKDQADPLKKPLTEQDKQKIEKVVKKTIHDYGDVLRWLAKE